MNGVGLSNRSLGRVGIAKVLREGLPRTRGAGAISRNEDVCEKSESCLLSYSGEAKALLSMGQATSRTGNIRHSTEKPKRQRQWNCTWIYLSRSCCVSLFFCPGNRRKIASAARDEMECFKGKWKIHERHFVWIFGRVLADFVKTVRNRQYITLKYLARYLERFHIANKFDYINIDYWVLWV